MNYNNDDLANYSKFSRGIVTEYLFGPANNKSNPSNYFSWDNLYLPIKPQFLHFIILYGFLILIFELEDLNKL
jgi:hypothetical protein